MKWQFACRQMGIRAAFCLPFRFRIRTPVCVSPVRRRYFLSDQRRCNQLCNNYSPVKLPPRFLPVTGQDRPQNKKKDTLCLFAGITAE